MNELPKIFVIAPRQMQERRQAVWGHLESLGLKPTLFSGLYGKEVKLASTNPQANSAFFQQNPYFSLTESRIALALNHWFLWSHIVMTETPQAIIFEDDIFLPDDFRDSFFKNMSDTPTDWEFIYLSILFPDRIDSDKIVAGRVAGNVWRHIGARTWDGVIDGLHAYMVTLEGARKMIGVPFTLDEPIDRWVSVHLLKLMNTYIWSPSRIAQKSQMGQWESTTK